MFQNLMKLFLFHNLAIPKFHENPRMSV